MNKKAMASKTLVVIILVMMTVIIVLAWGAKILFSSTSQILSLAPTKCNKALQQKDYHTDVVMFAARNDIYGSANIFYEPELAVKNFIGYLDCRNKEVMFDLTSTEAKTIDDKILTCGAASFQNHIKDLQDKQKSDPDFKDLHAADEKDYNKAWNKLKKKVKFPSINPDDCKFDKKL